MDNVFIYIIVGVFIAVRAILAKAKKDPQELERPNQMPARPAPTQPPDTLTEADIRYREIQAEIRRRIAGRMQNQGNAPMERPPVSPEEYQRSPLATTPINQPPAVKKRRAAPVAEPPPIMATEEGPAFPTAELALQHDDDKDMLAAFSQTKPAENAAGQDASALLSLRALLTAPGTARQAFILREIFDRPLCLRPVLGGGLENWN